MGVSIVPEMAIEKKLQCRYVRIADDQAVRTIGTAILRGRSLTRAQSALRQHLRSTGSDRMGSRRAYGAAARLGMKRTTLITCMRKHGIFRPAEDSNLEQAVHSG